MKNLQKTFVRALQHVRAFELDVNRRELQCISCGLAVDCFL